MGLFEKQNKVNITFKEGAEEWISYKQTNLKQSTLSYYKYIIDIRLNSILGNEKITKLKDYNFNNITLNLQKKLGKNSTRDTLVVLKSILKYLDLKYDLGLKLELITIPKEQQNELVIFTKDEIDRLEKYLKKSKKNIEIGIWISLYAGLKIGEVCALKWENIDMKNKTIEVKNTVQSIRKKEKDYYTTIEKISNNSSNLRIIPINDKLFERLNSIKGKGNKKNFILTNSETRIMFPGSYRKVFNRVLKKCGIEHKKYQALRHTFSTRCIELGMDFETLKEILGHTQVSTTLATYVRPTTQSKSKFINQL